MPDDISKMQIAITEVKNVFITRSLIVRKLTGIVDASVFTSIDKSTRKKLGFISLLSIARHGVRFWKNDNYFFVFHLWSKGYYHWITEVAIKLVLFEKEIRSGVLVIPENPPHFIRDFLNLYDHADTRQMKGACFVKRLSVISNPVSGHPAPEHIQLLRNYIFSKIGSNEKSFEKIYISRRLARARKVKNEQEVIALLLQKDFHCVELENMSWKDQVNMFRNCKTLLSIHGAGLTNLIFMPEGAKVIEIYPENPQGETHPNPCYATLSNTVKVNHRFLLAKREENGRPPDFHTDNVIADIAMIAGMIE